MSLKHHKIVGHVRRASQNTKVRFVAAGLANTFVDVAIFNFMLVVFSLGTVPASIVSTTIAMAVSYLLNKKAVFKDGVPHSFKQITLFLVVTLTGIWIVQSLIMLGTLNIMESMFHPEAQSFQMWFLQNVAKGFGIVAGAVWSYIGYSRFVFPNKSAKQ